MNSSRSTVKTTFRSYWFCTILSFLLLCSFALCTVPSASHAKVISRLGTFQGDIEASSGSSSGGDPGGGELLIGRTDTLAPTILPSTNTRDRSISADSGDFAFAKFTRFGSRWLHHLLREFSGFVHMHGMER